MFEEASEVFDNMFKSSFPLTFIVFIPAVLILVSPLPAEAAHEFTVYRMQQYDLQGQPYGKKYVSLLNHTGGNVHTYPVYEGRGVLLINSGLFYCHPSSMWIRLKWNFNDNSPLSL